MTETARMYGGSLYDLAAEEGLDERILGELDGVTALLRIMVEPLAASYGHTVICGQTLIPARGE